MGEVVQFVKPASQKQEAEEVPEFWVELQVWTCNACKSQDFRLAEGGAVICSGCHGLQSVRHFDPMEKS